MREPSDGSRPAQAPLKVLLVDDSPISVAALGRSLQGDARFALAGTATNGREAVRFTQRLRPDLISMDLRMPVMGGLESIEEIMATAPTPIVVLTGADRDEATRASFEAVRRGALELLPKPKGEQEHAALLTRFAMLARVPVIGRRRPGGSTAPPTREASGAAEVTSPVTAPPLRIVGASPALSPGRARRSERLQADAGGLLAIAASTGGPAAIEILLNALGADYPRPIVIVQHISPGFGPALAGWLDRTTRSTVRVAVNGAPLRPGEVLIGPSGAHLVVRSGRVLLDRAAAEIGGHRPSADRLFASAAEAYGAAASGVILTGMGRDGVAGLAELRAAGGWTCAQEPTECVVAGMPGAAIAEGAAVATMTLAEMARALRREVRAVGKDGRAP